MKNSMKEDLQIFNELALGLLAEEETRPVAEMITVDKIADVVDLEINDEALSEAQFKESISGLLRYTPKTSTPQFFNQLFGGRIGKAVVGELLSAMLNNSMYTYKVGGPMIMMEKAIFNKLKELIGYPKTAEGTIATGGSMTNFMALLMARDKYAPEIRVNGKGPELVAYTSQESHYSIDKNAVFAGIGRDNVRKISSDDLGRMNTQELAQAIKADKENGKVPFFVNATSGTTVLGAFDPLKEIAAICSKENLWMHIDGAYGGSCLFSDKYRHLLDGCELSDSFSINAHKMLGVPITCSLILTKHKKCMYDSFSNEANYLYQTDSDEINPGKISLQCGRRNDALKFWTLWKSIGTNGLRDMVDYQFQLAEVARNYVKNNSNYTLYNDGPSVNICFNYKDVAPDILCNSLYEHSELMIGYGSFKGQKFVRLVTINSNNSEKVILEFFSKLEKHADAISVGQLVN